MKNTAKIVQWIELSHLLKMKPELMNFGKPNSEKKNDLTGAVIGQSNKN